MNTVKNLIEMLSYMDNSKNASIVIKSSDNAMVYSGSFTEFVNETSFSNFTVVQWHIVDNTICIIINLKSDKKYLFDISIDADTITYGKIALTMEEAKIVDYASNTDNWLDVHEEPYSGHFSIDLNSAKEISE